MEPETNLPVNCQDLLAPAPSTRSLPLWILHIREGKFCGAKYQPYSGGSQGVHSSLLIDDPSLDQWCAEVVR